MIPDTVIEEILGRVSIADVIGNYLEVKRAGKNFLSLCPFHNDKSPSLSISPDKGLYHCFSCGASGNTVKFLMDYRKVGFPEAMEELARMAGIDLEKYRQESAGPGSREKERLYALNQEAMVYYHRQLLEDPGAAPAREYLKKRRLTRDSVERFRLGFGGSGWQGLYDAMRERGYSDQELEQASLVSKGKQGYFDRFRERIIYPIMDNSGRVAGFGGRVLQKDARGAKYLNSAETPVFHKSRLLFGLDKAADAISRSRTALVVEGYMDVIALHQNGIGNAVAALGTAFGESHLGILKRYCEKVVFLFDGDAAGLAAANRAVDQGVKSDLKQAIVILPGGSDPDDFSMKQGGEALTAYTEQKQLDPVAFKLRFFSRQTDPEKDVLGFIKKIFPYIREIDSPVRREDALQAVASHLGREPGVIRQEFERFSRAQPLGSALQPPPRGSGTVNRSQTADPVEQEFLALLVVFPEQARLAGEIVDSAMLRSQESRDFFEFVLSHTDSKTPDLFNRITDESLRRRASDLAVRPGLLSTQLQEVAYKLKLLYLKAELDRTNRLISRSETAGDTAERDRMRQNAVDLVQKRRETQALLRKIEEKAGQ